MKILGMIVFISLVLLCQGVLYADEQLQDHFEIDFDRIKLQPPFTESEEIAQEFENLATEFSKNVRRDLYNKVFLSSMVNFIAKYPGDKSTLSAKYYLAIYLLESKEKFTLRQDSLWSLIMEDVFTICAAISSEAPNSWQGKLSSFITPEIYTRMATDRGAALDEIRRELPTYLEMQDEHEYRKFREYLGLMTPIEVELRDLIINLELEQGNIANARKELEIIQQKYPKWNVKHLERNISNVYERQLKKEKRSK